MKVDSLFSDSLKEVGTSFIFTGLLPTTSLVMLVVGLRATGVSTTQAPNWKAATARLTAWGAADALWIALLILILSLVLQPLQFSLVQLLEGYWNGSRLGRALARLRVAAHLQKRKDLVNQSATHPAVVSGDVMTSMAEAAHRLRLYYPKENRVLPTTLGNVLRAAEDRAGDRYGLDAVLVWPRLYSLVSKEMAAVLADRRDQLDVATRFCATFFLASLVTIAFLYRHPGWVLLTTIPVALTWFSYRAAVVAGLEYGAAIQVAFDLHRFDLFTALHLPLPNSRTEERGLAEQVHDLLTGGGSGPICYHHPPASKKARPDEPAT